MRLDVWLAILAVAVLGVAYPILLYPALLWIMTRRRAPRAERTERVPGYTVVIPAHNEEKVIGRKLENTLAAVRDAALPAQIVVAADGCTDGTCDIVLAHAPEVELVVVQERAGIVGALKAGVAASRYPIVFFSDADIELERHTIRLMVQHFADPSVGGVCGSSRMVVRDGSGLEADRLHGTLRHWVRLWQSRLGATIAVDGANWAVRTSLLRWPTRSQLSEDLVVPLEILRQGYRFEAEPRAGAIETSPGAVHDEYHRKVRIIAGGMQAGLYCAWMFRPSHARVAFHYLSWKAAKWCISLWAIVATVALVVLATRAPGWRLVLAAEGGALALALLGGLRRRLRADVGNRVLDAAWYAMMAVAAPIVAVYTLVARRATVLWRMAPR